MYKLVDPYKIHMQISCWELSYSLEMMLYKIVLNFLVLSKT
jgi:hypothetical protein